MKYTVGTLENPENLNHLNPVEYDLTMKYCIHGFERLVFVVEAIDGNEISYVYLDNNEEHCSTVIKDLRKIQLCDDIMKKYLENVHYNYN